MVLVGRRGVRDAPDDAVQPRLARQRQPLDAPLHHTGEPEHRQQHADDRERNASACERRSLRGAARRKNLGVLVKQIHAERQRHQERQEDADRPDDLLEELRRAGFDGTAAEARRVVERVAVEAERAWQERAEEAPDQERAEHMAERQLDALPAQHQDPALHRGQDADELDARGGEAEQREGARVDLLERSKN